jgi:CRP/FNR family transcriptional regulator
VNTPYGLHCVESCVSCNLRSDDFFCALSPESLAAFNQIKHAAVLPGGTVVFVQDQRPRGVFILCQGQAKLSTTSREGKTLILRIARTGEVLGLGAVVTGKAHEVTAETMQPCQLDFVSREDFLRFLKEHGDACLLAAQHLSRECQDAYDMVRSIGLSHSISGRLAKFLLASAADGNARSGVICAKLALTHEDIAQLVGTSRESITRTLTEFRKRDIAELRGSTLIVHNQAALERLAAA